MALHHTAVATAVIQGLQGLLQDPVIYQQSRETGQAPGMDQAMAQIIAERDTVQDPVGRLSFM